jgi:hypothetical protein
MRIGCPILSPRMRRSVTMNNRLDFGRREQFFSRMKRVTSLDILAD